LIASIGALWGRSQLPKLPTSPAAGKSAQSRSLLRSAIMNGVSIVRSQVHEVAGASSWSSSSALDRVGSRLAQSIGDAVSHAVERLDQSCRTASVTDRLQDAISRLSNPLQQGNASSGGGLGEGKAAFGEFALRLASDIVASFERHRAAGLGGPDTRNAAELVPVTRSVVSEQLLQQGPHLNALARDLHDAMGGEVGVAALEDRLSRAFADTMTSLGDGIADALGAIGSLQDRLANFAMRR
jgi:hypothetical protein